MNADHHEGNLMRKPLIALLFTTAVTAGIGLTAAPAQAESEIVKLVSVQNGKCLQPKTLEEGDVIVQQACNGTHAQQWLVQYLPRNKMHLKNRASGYCLEVRDGAFNGARVDQWGCGNISNENWTFGIGNNLLGSGISGTWSHCIATPGSQNGLAVELRFCNGNSSQLWRRPAG
ncbi:RICIN domain-containing protein [Nonomuraea basaltis]|uniref:RICIN domain-containing protein n=1 Tax=Nonomuraea basaltis TaxID=2495887 RepID=UPI001486F3EE|nr:RICIN domain-containing protein [Nonomuraea basaltis]